ncbi:MAG: carboxymuconolactone decarboxylase family protein [Planctomycetota bacterium]
MKIDNRVRKLIAIGASVTANCQPCLNYHVDDGFRFKCNSTLQSALGG